MDLTYPNVRSGYVNIQEIIPSQKCALKHFKRLKTKVSKANRNSFTIISGTIKIYVKYLSMIKLWKACLNSFLEAFKITVILLVYGHYFILNVYQQTKITKQPNNNQTTIDIDEDFFNNDINFDQNCYFQYDLHLFSVTVSLVFTGSYNPVFLCYPFLLIFNNFFFIEMNS